MNKEPRVGLGVIIIKDNKVLLGKRKGSHGSGSWSFPGGHLEYGESIEQCAKREVDEEVGIEIKNIKNGPYTNDFFKVEGKHYITLYVVCGYDKGEVRLKEPDKCEKWDWFFWNDLPEPTFIPLQNLIKQNFNPFI